MYIEIVVFALFVCYVYYIIKIMAKGAETIRYTTFPQIRNTSVGRNQDMYDQYRKLFSKEPPRTFDRWTNFATKNNCITDLTFYRQIVEDLATYKKISPPLDNNDREEIMDTLVYNKKPTANDTYMNKFEFKNRSITYNTTTPSLRDFEKIFQNAYEVIDPTINFSIYLNCVDEPVLTNSIENIKNTIRNNNCTKDDINNHGFFINSNITSLYENTPLPIVSQWNLVCREIYYDIPMPFMYTMWNLARCKDFVDPHPWESKKSILFFRGTTTGMINNRDWRKNHRFRVLEWARNNKNKDIGTDVSFVRVTQTDSLKIYMEMSKEVPITKFVPFEETLRYRYHLVIDGNTFPTRLQEYLSSRSLVLYGGIFRDWYSPFLKPFVHYVPFKIDYSDLDERLTWITQNQDKVQEIISNANNLMRDINRLEQIQAFFYFFLMEYQDTYGY